VLAEFLLTIGQSGAPRRRLALANDQSQRPGRPLGSPPYRVEEALLVDARETPLRTRDICDSGSRSGVRSKL
jgi:hypothetical protein